MPPRLARRLVPTLLLAALLALAPAIAAAGPSGGTSAQVARRCARGRRCRRAARRRAGSGGVPRPYTPLFNADRSLSVIVVMQQERGGRPRQIVQLRAGNVPVTCDTSGQVRNGVVIQVPLRGNAFSGTVTEASGGRKRLNGHFVSATKAVGEFEATYADLRGGACKTGRVAFTATR